MCVAEVIKEARELNDLTHEDMANLTGVARSTYGAYERKERSFPDDVVMIIANELNSPQIIAEFAYEHNTEFFNTPVLNNVDKYPQVVIDVLITEASEMIKALVEIKNIILNKTDDSQLSTEAMNSLLKQEEQVGDVYTALKMHFISMKKYGVNVKDIEKRCNTKLKEKGYIGKKKSTSGMTY